MDATLTARIEDLRHVDKNVRAGAAVELGTLGDATATTALVQALGSEREFFVREYLTWALVRMGDAPVTPLIELLRQGDARARHGAVHTLSKIGDVRAANALLRALEDADLSVVTKAAYALGELQSAAAIPALVELTGREERELQATLVLALARFGRLALLPLIAALEHANWRVREQAASILGVLGEADAIPALVRTFADAQWQVRFAAAQAVGALEGSDAASAMASLLADADPRVRAMAARIQQDSIRN